MLAMKEMQKYSTRPILEGSHVAGVQDGTTNAMNGGWGEVPVVPVAETSQERLNC